MYMINARRQLPENGRYCAYLRKSREEMKQEELYGGDVLAKHSQLLEMAAASHDHAILHVFREVVSGETISDRPEMRELIRAVNEGEYDGVYVVAVDRLSRGNQQDQGVVCSLLKSSGAFVVTPSGYYDPLNIQDMDSIRFQLFNSQGEFLAYCRRMHDALAIAVLNGQYLGTFCPYGYTKTALPNGFRTLVPNGDADTVRMIFELYADGMSAYGIADKLTDMGIAPPRGEPGDAWPPSTVLTILDNEVYIGVSVWGKHKKKRLFSTDALENKSRRYKAKDYIRGEGPWEPLVSRELWGAVQERRSRSIPVKRDGSLTNIFAGIMFCGECGKRIAVGRNHTGRRLMHQNNRGACHQKGSYEDEFLDFFCDALKAVLEDYEVAACDDSDVKERAQMREAVDNLERQLATLAKRDKKLITMRADEGLTAEEFAEARAEIRQLKDEAQARLDRAREVLGREVNVEQLSLSIHRAIDMLKDDSVPAEAKNEFLRTFIERIEYWNESVRGHNDRLRVDIVFR